MSINIDFYNENKDKLSADYNSLSFEQVHGDILNLMPVSGNILDVGCGSGRDAFALAKKGYNVVAVDPAKEMLALAKETHNHKNITWINDLMPSLENVFKLNIKFDFILLSAVWMHIPEESRKESLINLKSLLNDNAKLVISLRHGAFSDGRQELPVSISELESLSENLNVGIEQLKSNKLDALNRSSVSWESVVIENTIQDKNKIKNKQLNRRIKP